MTDFAPKQHNPWNFGTTGVVYVVVESTTKAKGGTMFKKMLTAVTTLTALLMFSPSIASAHASLQLYGEKATVNGYGVLFVRIPHGCTGGLSTDTVVVSIPTGFASVRPQYLGGWTASTVKSGTTVTEVRWTGGSLADSQFADFGISVKYPSTAGKYGFKVVQYCGTASVVWDGADIPTLTVRSMTEPTSAAVSTTMRDDAMMVRIDSSSIYSGEKVTLEIASEGSVVRTMKRALDERGDLTLELSLKGKNAAGTRYVLREGSTVTVKMGDVIVGTATMGAAAAGSGH